ncbi:TrmH family RNA methyltransferase [Prevotella sp. OH937_COT-195]|uniref:TrmH family RNA methyltransferase n=1 Tax=Prevotella sp. OH937_COT-195 TaxID=2491051 RepID=UPI000F64E8ED|nr:RNA methyltransferase [Prevotella sp. OH937_COT-195]RRD03065.1 RNA methyltransferase [Prevotella sp. OH937_COT-195]
MDIKETYISSTQNPKIKHLQLLQQKSSERRKRGLFVVEGRRELQHCINAGFQIETIFKCSELYNGGVSFKGDKTFEVSREIYEKIAYRGSTEGIIAEVISQRITLQDIPLVDNPLIVVLESVEKPGNLGAVLRSADAAGANAVIICDPLTDLYNPNLIRSSIGAIFTVPCVACETAECIKFLNQKGIKILTAQLQDSSIYYDTDMRGGTAIVMGTEATGLSDVWRQAADKHIRIPMLGNLDSLNVSVSAAILLYEAVRQRQL